MHNASRRGSAKRIDSMLPQEKNPDGTVKFQESEHIELFRQAAWALASEWHEWTLTPEHKIRSEQINDELSGDNFVQNGFRPNFQNPDMGWYHFVNYLNQQMASGHTSSYDPNASHPDWPGRAIYQVVLTTSPASLRINKRELDEFRSGTRRHVKNDAHNPFGIQANWRRAATLALGSSNFTG